MVEMEEDPNAPVEPIDLSVFEKFTLNMPHRADRLAHHQNYEEMRRAMDGALHGCGPRGCHHIQPEDLVLKNEDCHYQQLQLEYWLHSVSFQQLFTDNNIGLTAKIPMVSTPSNKKIPECHLFSDPSQDFYLERLSRINTDNWEPVSSLMQQLADVFNHFDFNVLGTNIANYVDDHPREWLGALVAGWWCGAGGHGACAARCLAAATALAPAFSEPLSLRAMGQLLHMQSNHRDAKEVAYLAFYMSSTNKFEAFIAAVAHTYMEEYEEAVWMFRYALSFDDKYLPAKACLHATMCQMLFKDTAQVRPNIKY